MLRHPRGGASYPRVVALKVCVSGERARETHDVPQHYSCTRAAISRGNILPSQNLIPEEKEKMAAFITFVTVQTIHHKGVASCHIHYIRLVPSSGYNGRRPVRQSSGDIFRNIVVCTAVLTVRHGANS